MVVVAGGLVVVDLDNKLLNRVLVCNLFHHGNLEVVVLVVLVVVVGGSVVFNHLVKI